MGGLCAQLRVCWRGSKRTLHPDPVPGGKMQSTPPLKYLLPRMLHLGPVFCQHSACKDMAGQPWEATRWEDFLLPGERSGDSERGSDSSRVPRCIRVNEKKPDVPSRQGAEPNG